MGLIHKIIRVKHLVFLALLLGFLSSSAQTALIFGKVLDENNKPFPSANISIVGLTGGTFTKEDGSFQLKVAANIDVTIRFSYVGYKSKQQKFNLKEGERFEVIVKLSEQNNIDTLVIVAKRNPYFEGILKVDPKQVELIPSASGDAISEFIKRMPGVYSNNELSSQYSVRGGNFDENLIYVNGVEVFRPLLIRSGQQEGLNFVNSDLVKSIKFSSGGFDAMYGDKMSSVLDIEYKTPITFGGSASLGLQGGTFHLEGAALGSRLKYITGFRYKSNQYLLKTLDTKGDYRPTFLDWQLHLSYDISEYLSLKFLGNIASNTYLMIPSDRETKFGNIYEALKFTVYFDGQEVDKFNSYMGALSMNYAKNKTKLDFTASLYRTQETETYDIMGQYWLGVLQNDMGKDDFGEVVFNKGVGTFLNHARNYLDGWVSTLQHQGSYKNTLMWGAQIRYDLFNDRISEWQLLDSAGFSLPHIPDNIGNQNPNYTPSNTLEISEVYKSRNDNVSSARISGFIQKQWKITQQNKTNYHFNAGIRVNYWDFNQELLISPRVNVIIKPKWQKDYLFRFASGIYSQPAFYREMRDFDGSLNHQIKAQKSWHVVAGTEYTFYAWDRPFKLSAESYFKYLWDIIPYEIDDVKVRYFAKETAKGYATGIDFKLFGELVKDAESWVGVSIMSTQEDIIGDFYYNYLNAAGQVIQAGVTSDNTIVDSLRIEPGYIPRPTDQRINFNLFFQDYIPGYPSFKVHLNLVVGSGLPFGPPTHEKYKQSSRLPAYKRVDIGFSKQLISDKTKFKAKNPFRAFKSMWISLEVFNLLDISNTISYFWVTDVGGQVYGVPNYLTPRQLNLKLHCNF